MSVAWCSVCGGSHERRRDCPGELRATGPERHGWRVTVETPYGVEAYGVLVAPSDELWRARIITYPNVLWAVPGGGRTLKFAASTAQDAESKAIAFIEGHIKARGHVKREKEDIPVVSRFYSEAEVRSLVAAGPAMRKLRAIPVRFGTGLTLFSAMTGNLSESGLFVVTLAPCDPGTTVRVLMDLESGPIGLRGQVAWTRPRPVLGRQVGMGVELLSPPDHYREFVVELP